MIARSRPSSALTPSSTSRPHGRPAFLDELVRVADELVVVACPFDTPGVAVSEELIRRYALHVQCEPQAQLDEHAENGLPSLTAVVDQLRLASFDVQVEGNGNLFDWLALMLVKFRLETGGLRGVSIGLDLVYNGTPQRVGVPPYYRHVVTASRTPLDGERLDTPATAAADLNTIWMLMGALASGEVVRRDLRDAFVALHGDAVGIYERVGIVHEDLRSETLRCRGGSRRWRTARTLDRGVELLGDELAQIAPGPARDQHVHDPPEHGDAASAARPRRPLQAIAPWLIPRSRCSRRECAVWRLDRSTTPASASTITTSTTSTTPRPTSCARSTRVTTCPASFRGSTSSGRATVRSGTPSPTVCRTTSSSPRTSSSTSRTSSDGWQSWRACCATTVSVSLVIPDKRFCFDVNRGTTELAELVDAYLSRLSAPSYRHIVDFHTKIVAVDTPTAWEQPRSYEGVVRPDVGDPDVFAWELCLRKHDTGEYVDVHCHTFTPASFLDLMARVAKLGLLPFRVARFQPTARPSLEFYVVLEKLPASFTPEQRRHAAQESIEAARLVPQEEAGTATPATGGDEPGSAGRLMLVSDHEIRIVEAKRRAIGASSSAHALVSWPSRPLVRAR